MKKAILLLLAVSPSGCVTVNLGEETLKRVDALTVELHRAVDEVHRIAGEIDRAENAVIPEKKKK